LSSLMHMMIDRVDSTMDQVASWYTYVLLLKGIVVVKLGTETQSMRIVLCRHSS
jgi:hypothetical protein